MKQNKTQKDKQTRLLKSFSNLEWEIVERSGRISGCLKAQFHRVKDLECGKLTQRPGAALDVVWLQRPPRPAHSLASEPVGGPGKAARVPPPGEAWAAAAPLIDLGPGRPQTAHQVPRLGAGKLVRGRRVTCSRCSWATRRRGKWRKQSRALVKATVTAAPSPPAPARRPLPHIIRKRCSRGRTLADRG